MARNASSVSGQNASFGGKLSHECTHVYSRTRVMAMALAATRMMVA